MTTENFTSKTVTLTGEHYCKALKASHFLLSLVDLIEDSELDIPTLCLLPLFSNVALDLRNSLQLTDSDSD